MIEISLPAAVAAHRAGNLSEAERLYRGVLQRAPKDAEALRLLSLLSFHRGNSAEALRLARRATSVRPELASLWLQQADLSARLGQLPEALACLDRALALDAAQPDAWTNRGTVLARMSRHAEALEAFDRALSLAPDSPVAASNRGLALLELRRPAEALVIFDRVAATHPRDAMAQNNRGLALQACDRHEEAVAAFDVALALHPGEPDALNHRGVSLQALGRADAALDSYGQAIAARPDDPWLHWNAGLCRLLTGDYAGGWPEYEWRTKALPVPRFDQPLWRGEKLAGRTLLLLHTEQGLGDIIQFCRYAPLVPDAGRVILQAPDVLVDLLRSLPEVEVVPASARPPRFDLHCPLLSLPARFGSTLETLPRAVPYLSAPAGPRFGPERTVGICWQGNPDVRIDPERSVPLRHFRAIAAMPGVRLISLQKRHGLDQLPELPGVQTLGPDGPPDFAATAAAIQAVDLVISSDTVVAHLAGALGRPVWLATSFVPDWRWGLAGDTCPWYPTMRLFRQPRRGDWEAVFAAMEDALRD